MKIPGPNHPIAVDRFDGRVTVSLAGLPIADTTEALVLREARLPPVYYLPRDDVETSFFAETERRTHCPYKGDATHYTVHANGVIAENAAWSYEEPYPAVGAIAGRIAFYPEKVEIAVEPAR